MAKTKKNKSKKKSPFSHLTVQECHLIYPALLANANRNIDAAKLLSVSEEYGLANAHLIIAAEEYIKATSIYFIGWGLPVNQFKRFTGFFADKEEGFSVSPLAIIGGAYVRSLYGVFESLTQGLMQLKFLQFKKIFEQELNPLPLIARSTRYSKWWSNSKAKKENCLYVVYEMDLYSPADISEEEYLLSLEIVEELKEDCLKTIDFTKLIPEKRRKKFFKWIKNYFEPFVNQLSKLPFSYIRTKFFKR